MNSRPRLNFFQNSLTCENKKAGPSVRVCPCIWGDDDDKFIFENDVTCTYTVQVFCWLAATGGRTENRIRFGHYHENALLLEYVVLFIYIFIEWEYF